MVNQDEEIPMKASLSKVDFYHIHRVPSIFDFYKHFKHFPQTYSEDYICTQDLEFISDEFEDRSDLPRRFLPIFVLLGVSFTLLAVMIVLAVTGIIGKLADSSSSDNKCISEKWVALLIIMLVAMAILIISIFIVLILFRDPKLNTVKRLQAKCNNINLMKRFKAKQVFLKLQDEGKRLQIYFKMPPREVMQEIYRQGRLEDEKKVRFLDFDGQELPVSHKQRMYEDNIDLDFKDPSEEYDDVSS